MWRQRFGQRDNTYLSGIEVFTPYLYITFKKMWVHVVKKSFSDPLMLKNPRYNGLHKKRWKMPTQPSRSVTLSFCLSSRQYGYSNTYSCLKSSISKYFPRCTWLRIIYFTEVITKPKVSAIVIKYKIWLPFCFFPLATDINIGVIYNGLSLKEKSTLYRKT